MSTGESDGHSFGGERMLVMGVDINFAFFRISLPAVCTSHRLGRKRPLCRVS